MKKGILYVVLGLVLIVCTVGICIYFFVPQENNGKINEGKIVSDVYKYLIENGKEKTYYDLSDECESQEGEYGTVCKNSLKGKVANVEKIEDGRFYINDAKEVFITNLIYINEKNCYPKDNDIVCIDPWELESYEEEFEKADTYIEGLGYDEYEQDEVVKLSDGSNWYVYNWGSSKYDKYITLINKDNIKEPWDLTGNLKYNTEESTNIGSKIENFSKEQRYKDVKYIRMLSMSDFDEQRYYGNFETSTLVTILDDFDSQTDCIWVNGADASEMEPNKLQAYYAYSNPGINFKPVSPDHICIVKLIMNLSKENIVKD